MEVEGKRFYQLSNKMTLAADDVFAIDKVGNIEALHITGQQLLDFVTGNIPPVENVMNKDLTANNDRLQNMSGFEMKYINGKQFVFTNSVAPNSGASFDIQGYGSTMSDLLFRLRNDIGEEAIKVAGNRNIYIGGIGNSGARVGIKGATDSASNLNQLNQNLSGANLLKLDDDGQFFINKENLKFFKFGLDNYVQTESGVIYHRGNGYGHYNTSLIGNTNFDDTNFGAEQANPYCKIQITSTTKGFGNADMTTAQMMLMTPTRNGVQVVVNDGIEGLYRWQLSSGTWVFVG